jgi:hypothetical protein
MGGVEIETNEAGGERERKRGRRARGSAKVSVRDPSK